VAEILVCLGDANLCSFKWNDDDYYLSEQAEIRQDYILDSNSSQFVCKYTRSEIVRGEQVLRSCIDHCYSNVQGKVSKPKVLAAGDSDHLSVIITKFLKEKIGRPKTVRKRTYKDFNVELFLNDIVISNIVFSVTSCNNLEEADENFEIL